MASLSPYLQMLLLKKRPDDLTQAPEQVDDPITERPGPTIPIRPRAVDSNYNAPLPAVSPLHELAQQPTMPAPVPAPTIPLRPQPVDSDVTSVGLPAPSAPTMPVKPRSRVEEAADDVRKYDQGLHKDPKTGEWVEHKRNKGLQILEGLGNYAASGIGLNLQGLLHPRGTPEQQARRRLRDEMGIQDREIQSRRAETDLEGDRATIALRSAQARKIQAELDNPNTSEEAKAKLAVAKAILDSHPQGFDLSDPADVIAIQKLKDAGIPVPASYGKKEKDAAGFSLNPGEARYDHTGKLIVERAPKEEKPEPDVPDTTEGLGQLESGFRKNAEAARKAADTAEAQVKTYVQEQKALNKDYDPAQDVNVASMSAEARRQRDYAAEQSKRADDLAIQKVTEGNKVTTGRAKASSKGRGKVRSATHLFSIGAYIQRNPGATPEQAKAFAAKNYPGFEVGP